MTELLDVLIRCNVPFVLIGGHAVNYHGYIRTTEDHDIVFMRNRDAEAALLKACKELKAAWISDEIDPETQLERLIPVSPAYIRNEHLMMLWTRFGYLDIYDFIPGYPEEDVTQLFDSAEEMNGILFAGLSWLRKMKKASGRPRDLDDLNHLAD
jgi:hypothetical protein